MGPETELILKFIFIKSMRYKNKYLLIKCKNKIDKRLFSLAKNISFFLKPFTVFGIPLRIENFFLKYIAIPKKIGIYNIWYFSQKKYFSFLTFLNMLDGYILTLKIKKFCIQREFGKNTFYNFKIKKKIFLLLNNFYFKKKTDCLLSSFFKNIFPVEKEFKSSIQALSKIFFVDFDKEKKLFEFRCYRVLGKKIFFSRSFRKNKIIKKHRALISNIKSFNRFQLSNQFKVRKKFVRIKEYGPRLSAQILELFPIEKKKKQ